MKRVWLALAICSFLSLPAAQGQVGAYAEFSASQLSGLNVPWFYGSTFGAYYTGVHLPVVNFGIDARGSILGGSGGSGQQKIYGGLAGPRAILHIPLLPFKPYAEALIGVSHVEFGQEFAYTSQTSFAYGFSAGADVTLLPRLDWRVVEYSYSRLPEVFDGINQNALSTGIVLRLPIY